MHCCVCPVKIEKYILIQQVHSCTQSVSAVHYHSHCGQVRGAQGDLRYWIQMLLNRALPLWELETNCSWFSFFQGEVCWHIWQVHWVPTSSMNCCNSITSHCICPAPEDFIWEFSAPNHACCIDTKAKAFAPLHLLRLSCCCANICPHVGLFDNWNRALIRIRSAINLK